MLETNYSILHLVTLLLLGSYCGAGWSAPCPHSVGPGFGSGSGQLFIRLKNYFRLTPCCTECEVTGQLHSSRLWDVKNSGLQRLFCRTQQNYPTAPEYPSLATWWR